MSTTDDDTDKPEAAAPKTEAKPRRPRRPRAKPDAAAETSPAEAKPAAEAKAPAKRQPAKPTTRRAPARSAPRPAAKAPARTAKTRPKPDRPAYGAIAGAAGVGLALGVLAMLGRKATAQASAALAEDWATALAAEHQAARALFDRLEATAPGAAARRGPLLAQLKHLLTRHALQEENIVYPALRRHGWQVEADDLQARSGQGKTWLYELANSPTEAPAWLATLRTFRAAFDEQAALEDERLFPALRGELTDEQNAALARAAAREGVKLA